MPALLRQLCSVTGSLVVCSAVCIHGALALSVVGVSAAAASAGQAATQPAAGQEYEMLNQGAEPRRALRFEPKVGQRAVLKWSTESTSIREIEGKPADSKPFPISSIAIGLEIIGVGDGEITQRIEFLKFEGPDAVPGKPDAAAEAMRAGFAQIEGKSAEIVLDTRGRFIRGGFDPAQFDAPMQPAIQRMNQQLQSMHIPLPAEPVGVGAEWEVKREITGATTRTNLRATYRIKAIERANVTLEIDAEQKGTPLSNTSTVGESLGRTQCLMDLDLSDMSRLSARTTMTLVIHHQIPTKDPAHKLKAKDTDQITMTMSTEPWPLDR